MGGDNWAVCPRCNRAITETIGELIELVQNAYGKMPEDEYLRLQGRIENPPSPGCTLREDYEIGVDKNGFFSIWYSCRCKMCGFGYSYKREARKVE